MCGESRSEQIHLGSCTESRPRASHVPADCMRHMRCPIRVQFRSSRPSHGLSQRPSTLPAPHQSWRLPEQSQLATRDECGSARIGRTYLSLPFEESPPSTRKGRCILFCRLGASYRVLGSIRSGECLSERQPELSRLEQDLMTYWGLCDAGNTDQV